MHPIRNAYLEEVKKKRRLEKMEEIQDLPLKQRGRPVLLETKVQMYLRRSEKEGELYQ